MKLSIKDWAVEDRPREKLMAKGIASLTDAELIAILIGSGNRDETAVQLSQKILIQVDNNLNELGKQTIAELMEFKGIGEAKAITIVAALELGKRRKLADILDKKQISGSYDAFEYFSPILCDLPHEEFWVLYLNRGNKIIEKYRISQGGLSSSTVDVRLIMKLALEKLASAIVLCHNHPSGTVYPSDSDIKLTRKIKAAAGIFDITLFDHIIVGNNKFYSFVDEGDL